MYKLQIITQDRKAYYQLDNIYIKSFKNFKAAYYLMSNVCGCETALAVYESKDIADRVFISILNYINTGKSDPLTLPLEEDAKDWCQEIDTNTEV